MQKWCANGLHMTGLADYVVQVQALLQAEVRPAYMRAKGESIHLTSEPLFTPRIPLNR
ncbi:DUF1281 domain-containing protein [Pantoea sp. S62]|nr:DUF1281 domain-containing protein [Pantoea sp. S62]